jgi:hypothetical protein
MSRVAMSDRGMTSTTGALDGPFDTAVSSSPSPDIRPELLVAIHTVVNVTTPPATMVVNLRVQGRPARTYRFPNIRTAAEAALLALTHLVRSLGARTHVKLGLDDWTVARVLGREIEPSPWLAGVARVLLDEMAARDVSIEVQHIDLGDCVASEPAGDG